MSSAANHPRALLYVGHHAKLTALAAASSNNDATLTYYHARSLLAVGYAHLASGRAAPHARDLLLATPLPGAEFAALRIVADWQAAGGAAAPGADNSATDSAVAAAAAMLADPVASTNARARVVLGEWYAATGDLAAAHAAVAPLARESDVDATAVLVHVLLALNQAPLAASVVQALAAVADDAVTPQILEARVNLHLGGAKLQDARWGLDELVQTYAASPLLLTLLGVCHIALGNPADGARLLAEAVAMDPHACAEAQVDLVVAGATAGRSGLDQISQMWALLPRHAFTENLAAKAAAFDRAAANYST